MSAHRATVADLGRRDVQLLTRSEEAEVVEGAAEFELGGVARQASAVLAEVVGRHAEVLLGGNAAAIVQVAAQGDAHVAVAEQFAAVVQAGHVEGQALAAGHAVAGFEGQALGASVSEGFVELHAAQAIDVAEGPVSRAQAIDGALAAAEAGGVDTEQAVAGVLQLAALVVQLCGVEAERGAAKFQRAVLVVEAATEVEAAVGAAQRAQLPACAVVEGCRH